MKLLLDEQISGKVAERLRALDHDVIAAASISGLRGGNDIFLFEFAQAEARAFVTYDRADFEAIARGYAGANRSHHGLVLVHPAGIPSRDFGRLVGGLDQFLNGLELGESFWVWLQPPE